MRLKVAIILDFHTRVCNTPRKKKKTRAKRSQSPYVVYTLYYPLLELKYKSSRFMKDMFRGLLNTFQVGTHTSSIMYATFVIG